MTPALSPLPEGCWRFCYRRKIKLPPIIWHGRRPTLRALLQTRMELADLLDGGLSKPSDLCFHTVMLTDDWDGPSVHCWGRKGRQVFHAECHDSTKWSSLSDREVVLQ